MKKILLIEDEKLLADLLQKKLVAEGYKVTVVWDGDAGIQAAKEEKPNLILLDMLLPKRDGIGVLEGLNEMGLLAQIPVIVISNSGQPVEIERAKELGVKDWLIKVEFDPNEVIDKVKQHIS